MRGGLVSNVCSGLFWATRVVPLQTMATAICGSAHRAAPDQLQGCAKTKDVLGQSPLPRKQAIADLPGRHSLLCLKSLRSSVDAHRPSQPLDEAATASLPLGSGRLRRLLRRRIMLRYRLAGRWRILRRLIRLLVWSRLIWLLGRSLYLTPGRM